MVLVTEVPILAPMTIGIPTRTDITENTINGVSDGGPYIGPMTIGIPTRTDITENTINGVGDGGPYIGPHDDRYPDSHWYYWKYNKWC